MHVVAAQVTHGLLTVVLFRCIVVHIDVIGKKQTDNLFIIAD